MKLNLGAGEATLPEYVNVDAGYLVPAPDVERFDGLGHCRREGAVYPLAWCADASCSEVRASHVLEHFPHAQLMDVLAEWVRVLQPGGVLKIAVPDFRKIAEAYLAGNPHEWPIQGYVMGGQTDERDFHHAIFDEDGLREAFASLGLVDIGPWESAVKDCASLPVSLNLQGRKPGEDAPVSRCEPQEAASDPVADSAPIVMPAGAVKAVVTMPRLAFTDNLFCAHQALLPLGVTIERIGGVFWHQSMAELFERHVEDGTRYLLTLDYDTVFEQSDVLDLLRLMETRPEIDALCALQMRREEDSPLFALGKFRGTDPKTVEIPRAVVEADTMEVTTGHFGLTVLRTESLRKLPRPWFWHQPGPDGKWDSGRMDADIQFWHAWKAAGLTLHNANHVVVGHLELCAKWPNRQMRAMWQPVGQYHQHGKPAEAWR
jgi:hypothetical protein